MKTQIPARYHRINGWRGYRIPGNAVAGASDTGTWSDSPCPTPSVKRELRRLQRECLTPAGIKTRTRYGRSSNVFCGKRWLCVADDAKYLLARTLVVDWLKKHDIELSFLHDAN